MTDFLETILAARKKGGGWIVPIIFVVIYIVSALGKLKRGGGEEDIEFEKRPNLRDTEGKFRYKSLDDTAASQRTRPAPRQPVPTQPRQAPRPQPAARRLQPTVQPRPARTPSPLRPQVPSVRPGPIRPAQAPAPRPRPKERRVKPKAAPRAVQKPRQPQKVAAVAKPPAEVVHKPRTLRADLSGSSNLQRAIIYSEILGKPLALRDM
jgi:hypothetical protein